MSEKKQNTTFGLLLEQYRKDYGLSASALERRLIKDDYFISSGLISKYESGKRNPPAIFISKVSRNLGLTDSQTQSLVEALLADYHLELYSELTTEEEPSPVPPKTTESRRLKVFLAHASSDKPAVRNLHKRLRLDECDPWLDEENLLPGQDWEYEIQNAVRTSDIFIACLSRSSITKTGYVQKEIKIALDVADSLPENTLYIIPLKLEECNVPQRLLKWQYVNFFVEGGYIRLLKSLQLRAEQLGIISPEL